MSAENDSLAPVLVVDDEQSMRQFLGVLLRKMGLQSETAESGDEALERVQEEGQYALVLTDLKMPGEASGLDVLEHVRDVAPSTQVVVMTAYATPETAVSALKQGAYDYITKPFKVDEVRATIERALEKWSLLSENLYLKQALEDRRAFDDIIGASQPMQQVFEMIERVAPTRTTVLLHGESGTGKELVARAIHERSESPGEFVPVNCGAIPENLIEAELFGYVKGAFTGADSDHAGLFETADQGTLMLDEIGELPPNTQVRLLRVLQEKKFKPVGGTREVPVDVRIVAATNRDLRQEVSEGRFREDLFYRVNVITIDLPPLRERPGDIKLLLEHYIRKYSAEIGNDIDGMDSEALRALLDYPYPGNVRELQNIVERAVTLERGDLITLESLPAHLREPSAPITADSIELGDDDVNLDEIVANLEKELMSRALEETGGNRTEAAKLLGISFRSMRYRLDKYGMTEE